MGKGIAYLRDQRGFTLVEVVVVLVIIGILSAIAVPRLTVITTQAKERACAANIKAIETAFISYSVANNGKIPSISELVTAGYLAEEPVCPFTGEANYRITADGTVICDHCSNKEDRQ